MRNNFDQSSTGINITATVYYDTIIGRMNWEENFSSLQKESYSIVYYTDNGNVSEKDIEFSLQGSKEDLLKHAKLIDETVEDGIDLGEFILDSMETATILNYEELNKYDLKNTGLEIVPNMPLTTVTVRGYSQGDYAKVIYCAEQLTKVWGKEPVESELKELFTHLFYDCPIYSLVTINDTEYSYLDCPAYNDYEWNREAFIEWIAKEAGIDKAMLEPLIDKELTYDKG